LFAAVGGSAAAASSTTPKGGTSDCDSVTTCYTPGELRVAYGIQPLTDRGIDGRGEPFATRAGPILEPATPGARHDGRSRVGGQRGRTVRAGVPGPVPVSGQGRAAAWDHCPVQ
jgi:hypothetical protein